MVEPYKREILAHAAMGITKTVANTTRMAE